MPAPNHLLDILGVLGDGGTVEMAERVHQLIADAQARPAVTVAPQEPTPTAVPTVSFRVDTVEEMLGQLVGACSSTRFWDLLPVNYPYAAGTFQDQAAGALVDAAMAEYRRITADETASGDAPPDPLTDIVTDEQVAAGLADAADAGLDDILWDDDQDATQPAAGASAEPSNADIRAWCIEHDVPVNAKGAIRADARAAYDAAHQGA